MMHGESSVSRFSKIKIFRIRHLKTASADPKITKAPRAWKALALITWCEALSFRFRPGGPFGQNQGVVTAVWYGPL